MELPTVKPTWKAVKVYYASLQEMQEQQVDHEGAVRTAFQTLLAETAKKVRSWTLVPELAHPVDGKIVRPDGTLRDQFQIPRGYWEAKDTADDLEVEIRKKIEKRYPTTNTVFEDTQRGMLYQNGELALDADLSDKKQLVDLLNTFYRYEEPRIEKFEHAVEEFKERVPELARGLVAKIAEAHNTNKNFITAFDDFFSLCQSSLNPNISIEAVDEMLVQHLLTERLFRTIFDNPDFTSQNVIAKEVEKVISVLLSKTTRHSFLKSLDRFYVAIESAAATISDFSQKQHFLNTVYEQFFQGYSVRVADTHGIVYTPQPIVDFMCASVEEVLKTEFGLTLGSPDVHILDPCTGTGNFVVNLMHRVPKRELPNVYTGQLFANEIMLMPYYIAALNIEHAYQEITGEHRPFEGMCLVDTLDMAEHPQADLFTEANTERVEKEKNAPITVIIGNPPYNAHQQNENDNNKNREYEVVDKRIRETYVKDCSATLKSHLYDMYVRFFRWATDRLGGRDGILCFVSNNSFVTDIAFDGMRQHVLRSFTHIYHVDLHGNVRLNPKLSGTTHNVFGIQVGVGITVAVRKAQHDGPTLMYYRVPETWRKETKYAWLEEYECVSRVEWDTLLPDERNAWLIPPHANEFATFVRIGSKEAKKVEAEDTEVLFSTYSSGVVTRRDAVVYDFHKGILASRVEEFVGDYNAEVDRYKRQDQPTDVDGFVRYDRIKWDHMLKTNLRHRRYARYDASLIRDALYRPFTRRYLYFDHLLISAICLQPYFFPNEESEQENRAIWVKVGSAWPMFGLMVHRITDTLPQSGSQCFPFFTYNEDGTGRKESITDWALAQFRKHYGDQLIAKWDIFYYVYGILHHAAYREMFSDCLKRDLPRIPFAPDFWAFAEAGRKLATLHIEYENAETYQLEWIYTPNIPLSYRVDKMRLNKDKTALKVNESLTLAGIPPKAFEYRLGNRSALEWVIDQYRIKEDKRSGIVSDPNNEDDPEYIVRLVGQVINVSLQTVDIVENLPEVAWTE